MWFRDSYSGRYGGVAAAAATTTTGPAAAIGSRGVDPPTASPTAPMASYVSRATQQQQPQQQQRSSWFANSTVSSLSPVSTLYAKYATTTTSSSPSTSTATATAPAAALMPSREEFEGAGGREELRSGGAVTSSLESVKRGSTTNSRGDAMLRHSAGEALVPPHHPSPSPDANVCLPLACGGVRLQPGIERIDFDEGYYEGTIDEVGEMAGYGKASWHSGDKYEGEWRDGMMHGKGTYTWADGDYYTGDYKNGRMEGYGEMKDATGVYVGEWVDDMRQGYGRMVYAGGNVYEGEWLAGMRHGTGKLLEKTAQITYEGEFKRNEKDGRGVQTNAEGGVYEGDFALGKANGRGTYVWADGAHYIGMFKDGLKHGDGCEWLANGDWVAGVFVNGEHVDSQSTRHTAAKVNADDGRHAVGQQQQEGAVGGGGDDGGGVRDREGSTVESLSSTTAAALLAPLDAEKFRRIAQQAAAPPPSSTAAGMAPLPPPPQATLSSSVTPLTTSDRENGVAVSTTQKGLDSSVPTKYASSSQSPDKDADNEGATTAAAASTSLMSPATRTVVVTTLVLEDSDLEDWTPLKTIGKGSFGAVYTALLSNGCTVCCKVIELGNVENEEEMEKLRNEISLMKRLRHPNCVQYYGSFEDKVKNTLNIFMEYVSGGTLTSLVTKFNRIPSKTLRQWTYQMVCGVKYLHECGIVHRDIKGDNVLVSVDGIIKLADFGCSKAIDDVCSATHGCSTMVGTPYWMAPEVIKCEAGGYGVKSDIWSIGCTIVEMLTGKPPWPECNSMWAAVYKIANSTGLPTQIPTDVDPELMDLLEKCFERNPKLRPTAAEMLKHPFLAQITEGVSSPSQASSPSAGS